MSGVQVLNNVIIQWGGTSASPTWVDIPGVVSHEEPGIDPEEIDVTSYDSTSGWRDFIPGLLAGAAMTVSGNYVPGNTTLEAIRAAALARLQGHFRIMLDKEPSSGTPTTASTAEVLVVGKGKVSWAASGEVAGAQKYNISIKPSGALTITEPT